MNLYEVDILDTQTAETKRCPMLGGWNDDPKRGSLNMWHTKMCDCNLGGYHYRIQTKDAKTGEIIWASHSFSADQFRRSCDHSMPPKRFVGLMAYLADGRVIDLATGSVVKGKAA